MTDNKPKTGPKDFFLYFAQMVTLYVSAGSLIALLFGIINYLVVDPAAGPFYYGGYSGGMRFAIASLIIIFPLYLFLVRQARKEVVREPTKSGLWVRVWFIFITLFLTGAALVGDLIAVLNSFLGGELSLRFFLKVFAVLVVAGAIFGYYFFDLRRAARGGGGVRTSLVWVAALVVLATLITGFFVMGSPLAQREYRLDQDRANDLLSIQWEIVNYWQSKEALPADLAVLEDDLRGFRAPVDPVTGEPYEYGVTGGLSFELCATFDRESRDDLEGRGSYPAYDEFSRAFPEGSSWEHEAGRQCFERTIDPDFFEPIRTPTKI